MINIYKDYKLNNKNERTKNTFYLFIIKSLFGKKLYPSNNKKSLHEHEGFLK